MEETASVWSILTGDRIRLDDKEFEVLDKNPVPLGNEVGFCLNFKEERSTSVLATLSRCRATTTN